MLPIVQRARCPVLMLNLQPLAALDYEATGATTWLANCGVCPVPELAGVFARARIAFEVITGTLHDDERAWGEIERWCRAAGVARMIGGWPGFGRSMPGRCTGASLA